MGSAKIWTCKPPNDIISCLKDSELPDWKPLQEMY